MISKNPDNFIRSVYFFLCFSIITHPSRGADSITANQSLSENQTIVSAGNVFELGFFKTSYSKYYVGIWYKHSTRTKAWVANRETPISDLRYAELKILGGNLVLLNDSKVIWSTNVSTSISSDSVVAVLGDDGNLALRDGSKQVLWQSFDHPTDSWLPRAKLGYNKKTKIRQLLLSWKNSEDPTPGLFSLEFDPNGSQFVLKWNRTKQYWTTGAWNGQAFNSIPEIRFYNFSFVDNDNESYLMYTLYDPTISLSRSVLEVSGMMNQTTWSENRKEWERFWYRPGQQCDVYAYCGPFGICNQNSFSVCSCLPGFRNRSDTEWRLQDFSGGCVREIDLQPCGNGRNSTSEKDKFFPNNRVSLPDNSQLVTAGSAGECESVCLNNCSCTAYSYYDSQCLVWNEEVINLQQLSEADGRGRTVNVRLAASAPQLSSTGSGKGKGKGKGVVIGTVVGSIAVAMILLAIVWRKMCRGLANQTPIVEGSSVGSGFEDDWQNETRTFLDRIRAENKNGAGVPSCSWTSILAATDNFSNVHKLGGGGFGLVYKGTFPGGQEIAVKRLSNCSVQGVNEFQNEVELIAKLQHRNLVRLLGYCTNDDEKILLYEYMPNKSLDGFIFDQTLCKLLDWRKRFDIILGIARGVLYLHHDSRLRIIHRDLKTSNVLLDDEMNPKISDFGLARIVEGKGTEARTKRVVGTYGYMSPEYASHGLFSIKSDVFSFGVVVLEIICGKRNTGSSQPTEDLNLIAYVWRLWNENKALDVVDPILRDSCEEVEVIKCINIGLLCVEEDPNDRPTMSNVVYMLSGENAVLPFPKQPAFGMRRYASGTSSQNLDSVSNKLTMSVPQGR